MVWLLAYTSLLSVKCGCTTAGRRQLAYNSIRGGIQAATYNIRNACWCTAAGRRTSIVIHNSGVATAGAPVADHSLAAQQLQQLGGGKWRTGGRTNLDGKELLGQLACTLQLVVQRGTLEWWRGVVMSLLRAAVG